MKIDWSTWRPRLLYGAFFVLAFLLALRQTLPAAEIKDRLVAEAALRGWQLDAAEVGPAGLIGVGLRDATLKDKAGLLIPIESLEVSLSPGPLLRGRARLALSARLYDGAVRGGYDLTGAPQALDLSLHKVDLTQVIPLRKAAGMTLEGLASGEVHLALPAEPQGTPTGRADLAVGGAALAGGKLALPGLPGELTVPRLSLGQLTASVKLEPGKVTFEKLALAGGDAALVADGLTVTPGPKLEFAPIFGKVTLRLDDAFAGKPEGKTLKALVDLALAQGKGKDGSYALQVFGSLGHPQARPGAPAP